MGDPGDTTQFLLCLKNTDTEDVEQNYSGGP